MVLVVDLGSLYVKFSILNPKLNAVVKSEIVRVDKKNKEIDNNLSVVEVLINKYIESHREITEVIIIPAMDKVKPELITTTAVLKSKYQSNMRDLIKFYKREEKKKVRMGSEYVPPTKTLKAIEGVKFSSSLLDNEVFHMIEETELLKTVIYLEYINSEYLKELTKVINKLGKQVSIVSPVRAMLHYPLPKVNRIVVNYGDCNTVIAVISEKDGESHFKEIIKTQNEGFTGDVRSLEYKHELISIPPTEDTYYPTVIGKIEELKSKYIGYKVFVVGGYANYMVNDIECGYSIDGIKGLKVPVSLQNLLIPSWTRKFDMQYNDVKMTLKNKVLYTLNKSSDLSNYLIGLAGQVAIAGLILFLITSYKVSVEYLKYSQELDYLNSEVESYYGDNGILTTLRNQVEALKSGGKVNNYFNMKEFLDSLETPLEFESIKVYGKQIEIVVYAENTVQIRQFIETVKDRQATNAYTKFDLKEEDVNTVYRNGQKVDRAVLTGTLY